MDFIHPRSLPQLREEGAGQTVVLLPGGAIN